MGETTFILDIGSFVAGIIVGLLVVAFSILLVELDRK
mgnify:CR=1 FL=1